MVSRGFTSPEFAGRLSLACSRLRDSRTSGIEKARTRKKKREETFSFFLPRPHFRVFPTQASNQDFMWGGPNEAKVDPNPEIYFFLVSIKMRTFGSCGGGGGANAPRSPPWLRACHYLRAWNRLGRLLLYSFQILLAPCLHVRQPHSQGSRPGRREPRERGCMCAAFFSSTLSNLC